MNLHLCSPDHKLVHLYHTENSKEEVLKDNVRIDWEWEDLGDGRFARKGGRIVFVPEWVAELRRIWKIPESTR